MQRALTIVALVALLLMAAGVALDANIAQYGALNTRPGGTTPQGEALVAAVSNAAVLGVLLLLVSAVLGLILAGRRHQWGWLVVFVALAPAAAFAFLQAGFEADVIAGLASLIAPAVYLIYSLRPGRVIAGFAPDH
jgi:hypothetical protein